MATYTSTVTLHRDYAERISRNWGMISGKCDISVYSVTGLEITDITKYFHDDTVPVNVICDGVSDNMYLVRWDLTDLCFHAFYPFYASAGSETAGANNTIVKTSTAGPSEVAGTGTAYGQPGVECAESLDVGEVNFVAFGLI